MGEPSVNKLELFNLAAEIADPTARDAFLREACVGDVQLRADIEQLLRHDANAGSFLAGPAADLAAIVNHPASARPGTQIGPYTLVKQLGRGAMGVVYEAEEGALGRRVALKILPFAALLNDTQLQRFNTEATAAARLHHPGIVTIYSVGCERGIHFYAMQLIDGPSLAEVIAKMRNEWHLDDKEEAVDTVVARRADVLTSDEDGGHYRAVARIGKEAAEALQYAHDNGVLHRDVKPSNLLLDKSGHVWIADFGLARVEDESQLTRTGDILGTLRYMSPEQATGERLDARTDVYSLGATLYELATLQPVFDAENRRDIVKQVIAGNPTLPHIVDSRIPKPLSLIIGKAMARLDERYQSARELADDLQRLLNGEPVRARPPSPFRRVKTTLFRHPIITISSTALLILACLYIPIVLHRFGTTEPEDSSATSSTDTGDPTMFRNAPKKRTSRKNERIRQLRHEQLEDRRLLATGSISGTVFEDLNGNGVQDLPEEVGIENATVVLQTDVLTITNPNPDTIIAPPGVEDSGVDTFGFSVASMGNNILVGAHYEDPAGLVSAGAVYLFDGTNGNLLRTFTSPNPREYERFGVTVAALGDNVLVGTKRDHSNGAVQIREAGVVYLLDGATGEELQSFHDPNPENAVPDPSTDNWFGGLVGTVAGYVDANGNEYVLVGAHGGQNDPGAVYMFNIADGINPVHTFTVPGSNGLGWSLAVVGNKLLVSDSEDYASGIDGSVYLFDLDNPDVPLQEFVSPEPQSGALFGHRVAMTDQFVFVSSPNQDVGGMANVGVVFMFDMNGDLAHTFHDPDPFEGNVFARRGMSISGDHLLVTNVDDGFLGNDTGASYLFSISTRELVTTFFDPTPADDSLGGWSTILDNGDFVLSSPRDDAAGFDTGSVFVFKSPHTSMVTSTDSNGNYRFEGLDAVTYKISEVVPDGYFQTAPGGDGTHTVPLDVDETVPGINFANVSAYTTFENNTSQPLKDGKNAVQPGVTTSTIDVRGLSSIVDLNVTFDISHTYDGQLSARLIAPDGTPVELFSNVGGSGDDFAGTTFDDDAAVPITSGTAPFTGTFQPVGGLADFNDLSASGTWTLEISDNTKGETGTLNSWKLDIAALPAGNTPPVAVDDSGNTDVDTAVTVEVLKNDSDADNDAMTITSVTQPIMDSVPSGSVANHGTYVTFTPDGAGTYTFDYTISDGNGGSDTATVTMTVSEVSTDTAIYVYDIWFEPQRPGTYRAVFEIHADTNGNGAGDDSGVAGVEITVVFAGQTFTGTTDSNGIFSTGWVRKLSSSTEYSADVTSLALASYLWDSAMGTAFDDLDGDGRPDNILWFE